LCQSIFWKKRKKKKRKEKEWFFRRSAFLPDSGSLIECGASDWGGERGKGKKGRGGREVASLVRSSGSPQKKGERGKEKKGIAKSTSPSIHHIETKKDGEKKKEKGRGGGGEAALHFPSRWCSMGEGGKRGGGGGEKGEGGGGNVALFFPTRPRARIAQG